MSYQVNTMYRFVMGIVYIIMLSGCLAPFFASFPLTITGAVRKKRPMMIVGISLHVVGVFGILLFSVIFIILISRGI